MRLVGCLAGFLLAVTVGCGGSAETAPSDPYALSESRLNSTSERLTAPAPDSVQAASRARYAVRRMREAGLMPVFASSFLRSAGSSGMQGADPSRAHVMGYVAGRNPRYASSLVLVAADLDTPAAAATLETARRLALEALDTQKPERTVLVALWAPPRTGAIGLRDYVQHPTWALDGIHRLLLVTSDANAATESLALAAEQGIEAEVLAVPKRLAGSDELGEHAATEELLATFADELLTRVRAVVKADTAHHAATMSQ